MAVSLPLLFPYNGGCSTAAAGKLSQFSSGGKHVSNEYKIISIGRGFCLSASGSPVRGSHTVERRNTAEG